MSDQVSSPDDRRASAGRPTSCAGAAHNGPAQAFSDQGKTTSMTIEQSILRALRATPDLSAPQLAAKLNQWRGTVTMELLAMDLAGKVTSRESEDGRLYRAGGNP